uniref:VWFA domain-containing protein n=1 Tax=Angiostrongylus cantonensis TaxID=6313 RepID=A0A0K0CSS0_ANGCA
MPIILLIVDTSASMAQKTYLGTSYLDVARNIIDTLQKQRMKDVATRGYDRFFLITTEDYPNCIKCGWRENSAVLHEQLKRLRPHGRGSIAEAFMNALKFINVHRAQTGIDNYGCGRFPAYFEPVILLAITDSTSLADIPSDFRVLRYPSIGMRVNLTPPIILPNGGQPIESLCASTGGRSYLLQSHKLIGAMVDQIVQAIQLNGIIVRFECPTLANVRETNEETMSDRDKARLRLRSHMEAKPLTLVYVKGLGGRPPPGHWPIPEGFWHDRIEKGQLPPRRAHPSIVFSIDPVPSPTIQTDLPFDKYQLEPSPVAEYILDRHASTSANMCYQVFVRSSSRTEGVGKPFGYLKSASNGQVVNLIIMPYNYPVIVQLFEEYKNDPRVRNGGNWRARLDRYVEAMPPYYLTPLRNALSKMKIETGLLDERGVSLSQVYPAALLNYLNELKTQGKEEFEKTCTTLSVLSQQNMTPLPIVAVEQLPCVSPLRDWQPLAVRMKDRVARRDRRELEPIRDPEAELSKMRISAHRTQLHIHLCEPRLRATAGCKFRNPFIVPALDMVGHLPRLRANLDMTFRESTFSLLDGGPPGVDLKLHTSDELHQLPIAQMGNYEEYIKGLAAVGRGPLRPVEPTPVRTHAFGNPFKTDKKSLAIDEVGEGMVGANAAVPTAKESRRERVRGDGIGRPPKRKPGPVSPNCLQQWSVSSIYFPGIRERRRTNSDRSSVVSDLSYTLDLDLEMPSTSGENSGDETALNEMTNGLNNTRLIELAGLEPEAESGEEEEAEESIAPPPKRKKTEGLSEEQMMERKLRIAAIVRRHSNNSTIWSELCRETSVDGSLLDQFHLADFALRDSRRFKRTAIVDQLTAEIQRIRKLLAM